MENKKNLIKNLNKIHTTKLGNQRIKNNLSIGNDDVTLYCKNIILNEKCFIYKKGKNYYCNFKNIRITINSNSFTIITAHIIK